MKHFETNWKSSDGLSIFAQGWGPESEALKAVVCLVHGIGEHSSRYVHVAEAFGKEGFALFAADLRGHGHSEGPLGHFSSVELVMQEIEILLTNARNRYPGLPLFLYGHSLGAILVLYFGLKNNPDVKGVIATSPGFHNAVEKQPAKVMAAKILGSIIPGLSMASGLDVNAVSRDKKVVQAYINDPLVHDKISVGLGKIIINLNQYCLEHSGEFSLPLLLMHGKSDEIAFPSSSTEFAAPLNGRCKLVLWEGGYHELHNEPEKEEVLKTMTDWMKTLL
jgi:acylglycerol lipase